MKDNYCVYHGRVGSEAVSGLSAEKVTLNSFLTFSVQAGRYYR